MDQAGLLSPELELQLSGLTFHLKHSVRSRVQGRHDSPQSGSSLEFAEHKEYRPGDDLRHVNWKVYARHERFFVKQFSHEASAKAVIFLDASGSMAMPLPGDGDGKLLTAARLAAALSYVLLHQGDHVGLVVSGNSQMIDRIPPRAMPAHYNTIVQQLLHCTESARWDQHQDVPRSAGASPLEAAVKRAELERWHDTTLVVISDFFIPADSLFQILARLRQRKNRAILFHVVHSSEFSPTYNDDRPDWSTPTAQSFPFNRITRFRSPETSRSIIADPRMVRREYLARFAQFIEELRILSLENSTDYVTVATGEPIERFLVRHLRGG